MDRDQEQMQYLGVFRIYGEACKLIVRYRGIFSLITLTLILPLSVTFLAEEKVSKILFLRILADEDRLDEPIKTGGPIYNNKLFKITSLDRLYYILFKVAYFTSVLMFSLLSTAAVVYTVASVYTSREISFKKVMSVVPRVWKRLVVTFLLIFVAFFVYNVVYTYLDDLSYDFIPYEIDHVRQVVCVIALILYSTGFVYMAMNWLLASVVSVLEDSYGFKALVKSHNLIKGKMRVTTVIFVKLCVSYSAVYVVFALFAMQQWDEEGILQRIGIGILCVFVLSMLSLFSLVVHTIIYFVCKSHHHENIDKSALSEHLEVYLGNYVPLKAKDVQLQECSA